LHVVARMSVELIEGDCREAVRELADNSIDSCVTDPPYALVSISKRFAKSGRTDSTWSRSGPHQRTARGFMGKTWDTGDVAHDPAFWAEVLRVLKPGAHLLAFGGTRTYHRLACAIEDAGFEIRDQIGWAYGSGFPKSHNVQQAMNKAVAGHPHGSSDPTSPNHGRFKSGSSAENPDGRGFGAGAGAFMREQGEARGNDSGPWQGWGTALKPAWEPIVMARKPLVGTVAENVLAYGTGAINIDGCRVPGSPEPTRFNPERHGHEGWRMTATGAECAERVSPLGRWPANLIHDGSDEVLAAFPNSSGSGPARKLNRSAGNRNGDWGMNATTADQADLRDAGIGSAARFFYCAKASRSDRDDGLDGFEKKPLLWSAGTQNPDSFQSAGTDKSARNPHPTVKPTDLMRYLCRLVTPPGGTVLDPFMGSGSTGRGAVLEGFDFVGIEMDAGYFDIADARIAAAERRAAPRQAAE
jgi:site-specific DNA-methyltransferase (adenine-specific)